MRQLEISPEVFAALGAEQAERLRTEWGAQRVQCWECGGWIAPAEPAVVLLLVLAGVPGPGQVQFGQHAHPGCAKSEIREMTSEEMEAHGTGLGLEPDDDPDKDGGVDVVATIWPTPNGGGYPLVLISHHGDVLTQRGPDRQDLFVTALLEQGWPLVTDFAPQFEDGPTGYRVRYIHEERRSDAPGVLELVGPEGQVEVTAKVQPGALFLPGVIRLQRRAVVVQGSNFLTEWNAKGYVVANRAARAGALVGGLLPVELVGPLDDVE